jgi:hypothetical protein
VQRCVPTSPDTLSAKHTQAYKSAITPRHIGTWNHTGIFFYFYSPFLATKYAKIRTERTNSEYQVPKTLQYQCLY